MIPIVIRETNRSIVRLVFGMKDIQGRGTIFGTKYFNGAVEELTNGLNFRMITVDSFLALALNILCKWFPSYKL
jgi:hypothetical protein